MLASKQFEIRFDWAEIATFILNPTCIWQTKSKQLSKFETVNVLSHVLHR